ncbi:MAG TPA: ribosome-associated translation inhibitor RaiA [Candidatus Paceibacterota bacterium]|nr:ribosome-associated translation inhibitor RaiA [Candidatus Paceibacterota bacterium]
MKINITKTSDLTPSLMTYIEDKLGGLAKFVKHFDETGEAEIWLEISRTTEHHRKGNVFKAAADLRLPKKILRAEEYAEDIRVAIDRARNTLHLEIEKYKTKLEKPRREQRK